MPTTKIPWQLGYQPSVWLSSYCFCRFIMLSLVIAKHKEGKLSVPASVTKCVNGLAPFFSPISLSVSWEKCDYVARNDDICCETWAVSFVCIQSYKYAVLSSPGSWLGVLCPFKQLRVSLLLSVWGDSRHFLKLRMVLLWIQTELWIWWSLEGGNYTCFPPPANLNVFGT